MSDAVFENLTIREYIPPTIILDNLLVNLDAGNTSSYSGSGNTWYDLSGNGYNTTLYGSPTYSSTNGGSLAFNSFTSTQYAEIIGYTQTSVTAYTISAWLKTTSNYQAIICQNRGLASGTSGKSLTLGLTPYLNNTGSLGTSSAGRVFFAADTDASVISIYSNASVNDGNWHNVVGVFYRATGTVSFSSFRIYIDGSLASTTNGSSYFNSFVVPLTGLDNTAIGWHPAWQAFDSYSGKIDASLGSILIYGKNLSDAEVLQNYNVTKARFGY
jgi:hypothetical protein